jgi:hypothetical protein
MAISGTWKTRVGVPYSGAGVWGTGINPIHSQYGEGAPLRVQGRDESEHTAAYEAVPDQLTGKALWGYQAEDDNYVGVDYDHRPAWNEQPEAFRGNSNGYPPFNSDGMALEQFRGQQGGARRYDQDLADSLPSETVSEGWENKVAGEVSHSRVSDPSQYEIQTSMRQRFESRNNQAAVSRATDAPRAPIGSRVMGKIVKVYSGEERHADMLPREQDLILRPFWYRTAGTGNPAEMDPNSMLRATPMQRVPPSDPPLGPDETQFGYGYGYTPEDQFYA